MNLKCILQSWIAKAGKKLGTVAPLSLIFLRDAENGTVDAIITIALSFWKFSSMVHSPLNNMGFTNTDNQYPLLADYGQLPNGKYLITK